MVTELRLVVEWPETWGDEAPWHGPKQVLGHVHTGVDEEKAAELFEAYLEMEGFFDVLQGAESLQIWSRTR